MPGRVVDLCNFICRLFTEIGMVTQTLCYLVNKFKYIGFRTIRQWLDGFNINGRMNVSEKLTPSEDGFDRRTSM